MKKCMACFFLLLMLYAAAPAAGAAGFALPGDVQVTAAEAYVLNLDTGLVVYEQDAHTPRSIASLTKLMTALLLIENVPDLAGTLITAERQLFVPPITNPDSSTADIQPGETVRAIDMLYAMMLPSANEAAEAVGFYLSGGNLDNFYAMMNARAKELGCTNTNFTSTGGLVDMDGGNYSTAHDVALIAQACWQHEIFRTVCGTQLYWMPFTQHARHSTAQYPQQNPDAAYYIENSNRMMKPGAAVYRSYIRGIKTGSTHAAGRNFVSAAVNDAGESFIGVVLGCPWDTPEDGYAMSFHDTANLYDWIFKSFSVRPSLDTSTPITEVKVEYSSETDVLPLYPASDLKTILPKDGEDVLKQMFTVPDLVQAPVKKGDVVGTVTLVLQGDVLGTVDLVAGADIQRTPALYAFAQIKAFFGSLYFKVVVVLTVLFLAGYGLAVFFLHRRQQKRRRKF